MKQPKQQHNHADLYSQQRPVASSSPQQAVTRPTSTSKDGLTAAAAAKAAAEASSSEHRKLAGLGAAANGGSSPPKASTAVLASQQPSRIPMKPGQSHSPQRPAARSAAAEAPAAGLHAGQALAAVVAAAAGAAGSSAAHSSNGNTAAANGSPVVPAGSTSAVPQALQAQHLRSATMAESSDWSQDSSSTTSSDASSSSPTSKHSSAQPGSRAQDSSGDGSQAGHQGSASAEGQHMQDHSQGNGLQALQQQHGSALEPPRDRQAQQEQQQSVSLRSSQQQEGLLLQDEQQQGSQQRQQQQQQQQDLHANGSPGPPSDHAGPGMAAVAAAGVATGAAAAATAAAQAGAGDGVPGEASAAAAAIDSESVRARMCADPDYELPQGKLTETQVLLAHGSSLRLDRYGFILGESDMAGRTAGAPAAAAAAGPKRQRSAAQVQREQRRVAKWRHMLGGSAADFESYCKEKMKKVKRRVRKGIPDEFRGYAWQLLSGGHALMQSHPGMYGRLVSHAPDPVDLEIMRDLNRTFPNHVFFHQRQGPGQQSLFHVLRAYSALDKQVGYVQGMGFVSAILLMYLSEEAAFWTLVALLKGTASQPPIEGLYQAGMPLLQQCLFQFHELLKLEHPRLGVHLEQEGVVPSMYCTHWFNTLFAYSLPFEQLLRVWDVFLLEGMKVVFRVGIALLASAQEQLCHMPFERLVAALNGRKFPVLNKQPDTLMKAAMRIPVSKQLELLRERFLALQAETEAAAASAGNGRGAAGSSTAADGTGASHSSSKHSAAHAQQQLIAGFAPVPMGPNS